MSQKNLLIKDEEVIDNLKFYFILSILNVIFLCGLVIIFFPQIWPEFPIILLCSLIISSPLYNLLSLIHYKKYKNIDWVFWRFFIFDNIILVFILYCFGDMGAFLGFIYLIPIIIASSIFSLKRIYSLIIVYTISYLGLIILESLKIVYTVPISGLTIQTVYFLTISFTSIILFVFIGLMFAKITSLRRKKEYELSQSLENLNQTQTELKISYYNLEVVKNLVYDLSVTLNISEIMEKVISAAQKVLPKEINYFYCSIPSDPLQFPVCSCFIYAQMGLGNSYFDSIKKSLASSLEKVSDSVMQKEATMRKIRETINFEILGGYRDDRISLKPASLESIPVIIGNELLGIINISATKPNFFTQEHRGILTTFATIAAETLSRLRLLLETEQARTKMLVKSLYDGVIMFDVNQVVILSNPAAQQMTGLPEKGFYLSEFEKLFPEQKIKEKITQTLQRGTSTFLKGIKIVSFVYEFFILPIYDTEKKIIGGAIILHDITQAEIINRTKTEFVSLVSHQLRTPLSIVNWNTEMLLAGDVGKVNAEQKKCLDEVYQGNQRMVKLVGALLNVSRMELGTFIIEPVPTDINKLFQDVIKEQSHQILAKKLKIKTTFTKNIPIMNVDPKLLWMIFQNLLSNAIKYTPESGNISITTGVKKDGKLLKESLRVSIADNGYGIPKEQQNKIFTKLFRADNIKAKETDGTGLGLYIVKLIASYIKGKIWFESEENKGTTFYFTLPLEGMKKKEGTKRLE